MDCVICGNEIMPNFHLMYRGEGVCFHCAAYLEGVTKMKTENEIVKDWYERTTEGEYVVTDTEAKELVGLLKQAREPVKGPYCHGEPMQATERYLGKRHVIYIKYRCMYCHRTEEVVE